MIQMSPSINELATALSKMQSGLSGALKSAKSHHGSYANIESVWESIRDDLTKNGLSVSQLPGMTDSGQPALHTMLMHTSGQYIASMTPVISVKPDPQSYGSAFTYFRRYALAAIIGQVQTDDDGNAAMEPARTNSAPAAQPRPVSQTFTNKAERKVTEGQLKRLFAIRSKSGKSEGDVHIELSKMGVKSTNDLNMEQYDKVIDWLEGKV